MAKKKKELPKIVLTISKKYDPQLVEDCMLIVNGVAFVHAIKEKEETVEEPTTNENPE